MFLGYFWPKKKIVVSKFDRTWVNANCRILYIYIYIYIYICDYVCVFFLIVEYPKLFGVSSFHQQNSSGISTIFRIVALELWFAGQIPQEPAKEEEGGGWGLGELGKPKFKWEQNEKKERRELVYLDLKQPFLEIDGRPNEAWFPYCKWKMERNRVGSAASNAWDFGCSFWGWNQGFCRCARMVLMLQIWIVSPTAPT